LAIVKLTDLALLKQQALIGGEWHDAADNATFAIHNPANAETVGHAPRCTVADVERAIEAAHASFSSLDALNARRLARAAPAVRFGVALHIGEIAYGNIGGLGRLDFTCIGPAVNLAARIAAKAEGGEILASDVVRQLVAGKGFLFADRGEVALRGFEDPVRLYEMRWQD